MISLLALFTGRKGVKLTHIIGYYFDLQIKVEVIIKVSIYISIDISIVRINDYSY